MNFSRTRFCLQTVIWTSVCFLILTLDCVPVAAAPGQFEILGVPVKTVSIMGAAIGVDEDNNEVIYFNCGQPGSRLFLLQVNPKTNKVRQFAAPVGEGARSMIVGPDHCVFLGTWEGGYLLKFDPKHPEDGLQSLGRPSATETYIWELAVGKDQRVYGCTYPQARLVRHDGKTGQTEDLGRLDPSEMYGRSIASSKNGFLYIGIGTVRAQVVRFDPATGETKALLREEERPPGTGLVSEAVDGEVYARIAGKDFHCDGDKLVAVKKVPERPVMKLRDGRTVSDWISIDGKVTYTLTARNGKASKKTAAFDGAGIHIFAVGAGPKGRIYGSTVLPLEVFDFTPKTKELRHLGNSTGAEIYSFATDGKVLYSCAYPRGYLAIYDPTKSWNFGEHKNNNPRGFGYMGDGHLRPQAMIIGFDGRVYVGSLPPYGQLGGAMGIYDPKKDSVVENYRNLIPEQGISALCAEPITERIFGGSSVEAGGGARPVAKECFTFAWNPKTKQKEWESVVVPGDRNVAALTTTDGKVFGVSRPSQTLFVLDGKTFEVLHKSKVPFGPVHEVSLCYYQPHDCIYGLARNSIFTIDPKTYEMKELARSDDEPITCGLAVTETGIYFGSKMQLVRWNWRESK